MVQLFSHDIETLLDRQRTFFATGVTRAVAFRLAQLKKLKQAVKTHQADLSEAIQKDLGRPVFESHVLKLGCC